MFILPPDTDDLRFPPVHLASPEGLLAVGGDLCAERLLEAYRHGIFPWYNEDQPILWWSPDPRAVLYPSELHVSRSLRKTLRQKNFRVTLDTAFRAVVTACAGRRLGMPDDGEPHTWITAAMVDAYVSLHENGYAHSVEVWAGDGPDAVLAGGLYGVALGGAFFGESMFSRRTDASKVALVWLARQLSAWGFRFIDCQLPSAHLFTIGAREIPRRRFVGELQTALTLPDRAGRWTIDRDFDPLTETSGTVQA
ncbi:MAG: leucyl/phenylalanyl-tRNA--protein transferase [Candidatus Muproteobacteria bacterium RBG_16_62_13]|uniref:Leucyl/phenylalanyl-tRNA--protein transferase n=1 Tax=Candidatus Muproteobacteria bacterium RBG_16_62_13 TaxID=1817756 RepID=A0A1F6SWE8_9PROT|nr:MAG: leucyl/phenylalanyl-tRNA--protein transferase [Candidatus Muproteobacteria bacterium RBG_16_62_13]